MKLQARTLGADLVGIADCQTLNAHPPDPTTPQTPNRISERFRSCIVLAKRMPLGEFLSDHRWVVAHNNQVVMRVLERVASRLTYWLDSQGYYSVQVATEETDPELKRGSYGYLSMRHLAVEAGLGTFGLESNLLTPEFGPRVYFAAVLTEAELLPDRRMLEQVCIGETCGRCLLSCPTDAILHWALDKRLCAMAAQVNEALEPLHVLMQNVQIAPTPRHVRVHFECEGTRSKHGEVMRRLQAAGVFDSVIALGPVQAE